MDNTVGTIAGTIAVAALGGLTSIAYNHPKAFVKLSMFLNGILILAGAAAISWSLSNQWASGAANHAAYDLCSGKAYEIWKAVDAYTAPAWLFLALIILGLYILFLLTFPLWLLDEQPPEHRP